MWIIETFKPTTGLLPRSLYIKMEMIASWLNSLDIADYLSKCLFIDGAVPYDEHSFGYFKVTTGSALFLWFLWNVRPAGRYPKYDTDTIFDWYCNNIEISIHTILATPTHSIIHWHEQIFIQKQYLVLFFLGNNFSCFTKEPFWASISWINILNDTC